MATMKQVADHAKVSIATVSRVINNSGYVSPDLRERVNDAMQMLDYQPSQLARNLRRQRTQTIGILIPQLDHPFFSRLAFAIEKVFFQADYHTLICSAEEDLSKENAYIDMLLRQRVDGVIFVPTGHSIENLRGLIRRNVPVVLVDRDLKGIECHKVISDNYTGAYEGTIHLLELGHRNISIIGGPDYSEPMMHRLRGIQDALATYNIRQQHKLHEMTPLQQFEMGHSVTHDLLKRPDRPTAIFGLTDVIAIGAMHAASEAGLTLPQDLSVMGFDDIPIAAFSIPPLTTIAQPIYEMGERSAEMMLNYLEDGNTVPETSTLETHLVVRESTSSPGGH